MRPLLALLIALVAGTRACAMLVSPFPGLQEIIELSDAVVVLRVDQDLLPPDRRVPAPRPYRCFIEQTLKGEIVPNVPMTILLYDVRSSLGNSFSTYSRYVVFLKRTPGAGSGSEYSSYLTEGSMIRLSPLGSETMPQGATVADRIRVLLAASLCYWEESERKERKFVASVIRREKKAEPGATDNPDDAQRLREDH